MADTQHFDHDLVLAHKFPCMYEYNQLLIIAYRVVWVFGSFCSWYVRHVSAFTLSICFIRFFIHSVNVYMLLSLPPISRNFSHVMVMIAEQIFTSNWC